MRASFALLVCVATAIAGCSASSGDTVRSCAEATRERDGAPCSGFTYCDGCPLVAQCIGGVLHADYVLRLCDAGPLADSATRDAGDDGASQPSRDAGPPVSSCDGALAAFAAIPRWDGRRDTGIACEDFGRCWACPILLTCVGGTIQVDVSSAPCDTGPRADSATDDAGSRFDTWTDCSWIDGANTCLRDGVAACDAVAGGAWASLGSSAMRTCARHGDRCDVAYFTETEGGAAAYRCSITIGSCGLDRARDCVQVLSCNPRMGDCPSEIVPTNVIPCALAFP